MHKIFDLANVTDLRLCREGLALSSSSIPTGAIVPVLPLCPNLV